MSSIGHYPGREEFASITSRIRTTLETSLYGNNVREVSNTAQAFSLAKQSPGTIECTGMPVYKPEAMGLPKGANVLLFNDGAVYGRCAAARRIVGPGGGEEWTGLLREAVYGTRNRTLYHAQAVVGLDAEFMVRAHLIIPEGHENVLYSWMLNFQYLSDQYRRLYAESKEYPEGDIILFSDPDWRHSDHPLGLALFDPEHNCAAVLGMRYFGEHKKGTLTLGWGTAVRHGYASCHGGLKRYELEGGDTFTAAVFGLSGSGKSTITHARHGEKYDVTVLHDDAFIIHTASGSAIALEPAYFDKTQDYPTESPDNKYLLTLQNNGAARGDDGLVRAVTEDLRNGNGRAVKSRLWSPNRVDRMDGGADAVFWLMKDPTLPPVVRLDDPDLAAVMGATLATKRTSAERLAPGVDPDALVVEPYANPFRTYPLATDFERFRALIADGSACYILNTGHFMDKKVEPKHTLGVVEAIVEGRAKFQPWAPLSGVAILPVEGFEADLSEPEYRAAFLARLRDRIAYVENLGSRDALPVEAIEALRSLENAVAEVPTTSGR